MRTSLLSLMVGCLALSAPSLWAQPPMPKPGPEHEKLKWFAGDWDVTVAFMGQESKATATYKMDLGGFWLREEFHGTFAGQKFEGRGASGYDPIKKKYVGAWIDSMSPSLMVMEGSFSSDGKTFTETGEGPGPDGKMQKMKSVYQIKDNDSFVFTMYMTADGKEQEAFKLTYRRKK
jgi:hypothetical protein